MLTTEIYLVLEDNSGIHKCTCWIITSLNLFKQFCKPPSCVTHNGFPHFISCNNKDEGQNHQRENGGKINAGDLTSKLACNKSIRSMMCNKHWTGGDQNKKQGNLKKILTVQLKKWSHCCNINRLNNYLDSTQFQEPPDSLKKKFQG